MANPVIHIEHISSNLEQGLQFYTKLFDWKVEDMPVPDSEPYKVVKANEGANVGFLGVPDTNRPTWLTYIRVDDIKASVAKAVALGATVVEEVAEFGEYGWSSVISDPAGAVFAIWQYKDTPVDH
jgi:predicted enzyme related to lactoylglutathione lyase